MKRGLGGRSRPRRSWAPSAPRARSRTCGPSSGLQPPCWAAGELNPQTACRPGSQTPDRQQIQRHRNPRKQNDKQAPEMQNPGTRREEAIGTSAPELMRIPHPPVHGGGGWPCGHLPPAPQATLFCSYSRPPHQISLLSTRHHTAWITS